MLKSGFATSLQFGLALFLLGLTHTVTSEEIKNAKASYIDVAARHRALTQNHDTRTAQAIKELSFCTQLAPLTPPSGHMIIPPHYLSGGHGPINPAEAPVTRLYNGFEHRVTAGMNQWLVTGSRQEAQCAQQQIDSWAQAGTLLDYDPKESSQAWFQVEWTLSAVAISESVLLNEPSLDRSIIARDIAWMNKVAHRTVEFDKASTQRNNHHYWRGLAATAVGVISSDSELFSWGIATYKEAINELDQRGALPLEMARHERAIHYQSFALQPLVPLAAFAERQGVPLMLYRSPSGKTISDAVNFFGHALDDPTIIKAYTPEEQLLQGEGKDFFAFAEIYSNYFPQLPQTVALGLTTPTFATRIGGSMTVISGYVPSHP
ncbi:MAG: alginate lyase family protein [Edaphobacter sp.]|uniref:alginate lyase family protein n=1 Tax=Edaphobacter sp. TaxID=1934404 RepID=UPI0023A0EAFA|nr:alginate lyase family protein [Edaphobacter sp.]MDE1177637.1 alginate lyase family protein [Edaphobacter sp.]